MVVGAGAAGVACTEIMLAQGVGDVDRLRPRGRAVPRAARTSTGELRRAGRAHQPARRAGTADEVLAGADVVHRRCPAPGAVTPAAVRTMARDAIVFAMANPMPEVQPEEVGDDVAIMATGRSDYPNQINNVLAFPGVFRGALDVRATTINEEMKLAAAQAIAAVIPAEELHADYVIPSVFNRRVAESVADAVAAAAVGQRRRAPQARGGARSRHAARGDAVALLVVDLGHAGPGRDTAPRHGRSQSDERDLAAVLPDDASRPISTASSSTARTTVAPARTTAPGSSTDSLTTAPASTTAPRPTHRPRHVARHARGRGDQAVGIDGAALHERDARSTAACVRIGQSGSSRSIGGGSPSRSWWLSQYASTVPTSRQ